MKKKNKQRQEKLKFPFWARLKLCKNRTTLVIDEDLAYDKKSKMTVEGYVHREATHTNKKGFEKVDPNPDKTDKEPMYLKPPRKLPKTMFKKHNKNLFMPKHLREKYKKTIINKKELKLRPED